MGSRGPPSQAHPLLPARDPGAGRPGQGIAPFMQLREEATQRCHPQRAEPSAWASIHIPFRALPSVLMRVPGALTLPWAIVGTEAQTRRQFLLDFEKTLPGENRGNATEAALLEGIEILFRPPNKPRVRKPLTHTHSHTHAGITLSLEYSAGTWVGLRGVHKGPVCFFPGGSSLLPRLCKAEPMVPFHR